MAKIKVYGYRGCSTCKKAYSFLDKRKLAFEEIDITTKAPTKKELQGMLAAMDGKLRALFNTSGQAYRELGMSEKLPTLSESEALSLLAGNGRLVKRPFLVVDGEPLTVGYDEARWKALLA